MDRGRSFSRGKDFRECDSFDGDRGHNYHGGEGHGGYKSMKRKHLGESNKANYEMDPIEKYHYNEHPNISGLNEAQVQDIRNAHEITVIGRDVPRPITNFYEGNFPDVDDVKFVINIDFPNCSEDYIHCIGCTARSNNTGTAYTFFTFDNRSQAEDLVEVLREANQSINPKLIDLVEMSRSFSFGKDCKWKVRSGGGRSRGASSPENKRHHPYECNYNKENIRSNYQTWYNSAETRISAFFGK